MFHVDALPHDLRTGQQDFEETIARIFPIVVGMQKDTASQVESLRQLAASDQERRIAGKTPLRSDLAPIQAPSSDMGCGLSLFESLLGVGKPHAAFPAGERRGFF